MFCLYWPGVSLNAIIGDDGVISNAQNAKIKSGMAELEEWLNEKYTEYYGDEDNYSSKQELLSANMPDLFLKDSYRNYILKDGKVYYLINKAFLPKRIKDNLIGGDTQEWELYMQLEDVYGVTDDLKVYYYTSDRVDLFGNAIVSDINPKEEAKFINKDNGMKSKIIDFLREMGNEIDDNATINLADVSMIKEFSIDGNKYNITSLEALRDLTSLKILTLENLTLKNLEGLEYIQNLYYIYFKGCTVGNYNALSGVSNLEYLYMYLPSSIVEKNANDEVLRLGNGLENANKLKKLTYFGISGDDSVFEKDGTRLSFFYPDDDSAIHNSETSRYVYSTSIFSNLSDLSGLAKVNDSVKQTIKYMCLHNNNVVSISALAGFNGISLLDIHDNKRLESLDGVSEMKNLTTLLAFNCNLTDISNLESVTTLESVALGFNSNLMDLHGLENSVNLTFLLANNNDLTDIIALKNCANLAYLNLENNKRLENIEAFSYLNKLEHFYLLGNENMSIEQVKNILGDKNHNIFANCGRYYSLPSKFLLDVTGLRKYDFSYSNYKVKLNDTSEELDVISGLESLVVLNLSGQDNISSSKLNEVLSTLKNLEILNLNGCGQLSSLEFIGEGKVDKLKELSIKGVSNNLIDLSNLNSCVTTLNTLWIDNPKIDLSLIQSLIKRLVSNPLILSDENSERDGREISEGEVYSSSLDELDSLIDTKVFYGRGLILDGDASEYKFPDIKGLDKFYLGYPNQIGNANGILDLSKVQDLKYVYVCNCQHGFKFPSGLRKFVCDGCPNDTGKFDFSLVEGFDYLRFNWSSQSALASWLNTLSTEATVKTLVISSNRGSLDLEAFKSLDFSGLEKFYLLTNSYKEYFDMGTLDVLNRATNLKEFKMFNRKKVVNLAFLSNLSSLELVDVENCSDFGSLSGIEKSINLKYLTLINTNVGTLDPIARMNNLEEVILEGNKFSNISPLSNKKGIKSISLVNNSIQDISPLMTFVDENGNLNFNSLDLSYNNITASSDTLDTLRKLNEKGLVTVILTGNDAIVNDSNYRKKIREIFDQGVTF